MATISVNDWASLRAALTDTTSTLINFECDIVINTSGGAVINRTKGDVTIDGNGHTLTDYSSTSYGDAMRIGTSGSDITVTVRNMNFVGRNYYGIVQIYDGTYGQNVTLTLDHVNYTGPQAVHNRRGVTRVVDSTFCIERNGGPVEPQEFGELNRVIFEGTVSITSSVVRSGALYSVMWFANTGTILAVADMATLTIDAPTTYLIYSDASAPAMVFGEGSSTTIRVQSGLFFDSSALLHSASSFSMSKGAKFVATQSARNGLVPMFKCTGTMHLASDSHFELASTASGTGPLLYFATLTTVEFDRPANVVLYNNGGRLFSFGAGSTSSSNIVIIRAELVNIWSTASAHSIAGSFDDPPTRAFARADGSDIVTTVLCRTNAVNSLTTNITTGDPGAPMDPSTLDIINSQVLAFGYLPLVPGPLCDLDTAITGTTRPLADLRASFDSTQLTGTAHADGEILLPLAQRLVAGTIVTLGANRHYLTKYVDITTAGSVSITHLDQLVFHSFVAPYPHSRVSRIDPDWFVQVTDTRLAPGPDWSLFVTLPAPLSHLGDTLDDAVVLVDGTTSVLGPTPILVCTGQYSDPPPTVTNISWERVSGLLLDVIPDWPYAPGEYVSLMHWHIEC